VSQSEYPTTDAGEIKQLLGQVLDAQSALNARLDGQAAGINSIGENLDWLVQNTKGLFQMFASPQFAAQMTNLLMSGMGGAKQDAGQQGAAGSASGTDSG
jgi:hypothetical protein